MEGKLKGLNNVNEKIFCFNSFLNAYVGELITERIARKRDFKYLAILDHKSHVCTIGNKKRKSSRKDCLNHGKTSFVLSTKKDFVQL